MIRLISYSFLVLITLQVINAKSILAQDFDVQVVINMESLSPDAKDRLRDFKQQVEDYFNKNKFYDNMYFNDANQPGADAYKIKATLQFNFRSNNGFDSYDAQLLIQSQRIVDRDDKRVNPKWTTTFKFLDERCSFSYNRALPFIRNEMRFDTFLSLLDYYAYMILGYDQDTFFPKDDPKNKSIYFQKALNICNKPMSDRTGWTETGGGSKPSRLQLAQELLNPRFGDYRNGVFEYHWMGLDSLGYTKNAYQYILSAIQKISNIRKKEVKAFNIDVFFESKYLEIAEIFQTYSDRNVYDLLMQYDQPHQRTYDEAKKKGK